MKSILLISYLVPCRGHAGGLRLLDLYRQIKKLQPDVYIELVTCRRPDIDWGYEEIEKIFNRVHWLKPQDYNLNSLEQLGVLKTSFDIIDLQHHQSGVLIKGLKRICPHSQIIFSPMESMIRAAMINLRGNLKRLSGKKIIGQLWRAWQEAIYIRQATKVCCVSLADQKTVLFLRNRNAIFSLPTALSPIEFENYSNQQSEQMLSPRTDNFTVVFVAYFGSQTNRDALHWFVKQVHPYIKKQVPSYVLSVVGRGLDKDIMTSCKAEGIRFIGEVTSIESELHKACFGVAPAISGAGIRGKIHQYAFAGLPCVASKIVTGDLDYTQGKSILIANSAEDFSHHCIALLRDAKLRDKIGQEAKKICLEKYTWESLSENISNIYALNSLEIC